MNPTIKITRESIKSLLKSSAGTILSVVFTKKNGEERHLNGRLKVTKYLKGGVNTTVHIDKYITIYDLQNDGYRNVNIETVKEISVRGKHYIVEG